MPKIKWDVVVSEPFSENAYLVYLEGGDQCLIVDPGFDAESMIEKVQQEKLTPAAILNTHGHLDHIAGNEALRRCWPELPIVIGRGDAPMLTDPDLNLSTPFGMSVTSPPADRLLDGGESYEEAGISWEIFDAPGHSPGHILFVCKSEDPWIVLGGDVLFQGSVGRTDFPGGNAAQLIESIRSTLLTFPDSTIVLPGHGPPTTIGAEKLINPFI